MGGQEHTDFCPGLTRSAVKAAICEGSTELYLDGVFLRGVFVPTSPLHPADRACLAPDHINGPTQLPGTKHRHLVRLTSTTRNNFPCCQQISFMLSFPPGKHLSNWEEKLRRSPFAFLRISLRAGVSLGSLSTQSDPKNHHK